MIDNRPWPQFCRDLDWCESQKDMRFTRDEAAKLFAHLKTASYLRLSFHGNGCIQRRGLIQHLLTAREIPNGYIEIKFNRTSKYEWSYHTAATAELNNGETVVFDMSRRETLTSPDEFKSFWTARKNGASEPKQATGFSYSHTPKALIQYLFTHRHLDVA